MKDNTMQVEIRCPRCDKFTKYVLIPKPVADNVAMIQEKAAGEVSNWENRDGVWACMGCMEDHGLEWLPHDQENG